MLLMEQLFTFALIVLQSSPIHFNSIRDDNQSSEIYDFCLQRVKEHVIQAH